MTAQEILKHMVQAYVEDACHYLAMDSNLFCINYVPKIEPVAFKPQNKIAGMGASINIGSQFLDNLDSSKYKMLRFGFYALVRHIAQRIKNKDSDWSQNIAAAFGVLASLNRLLCCYSVRGSLLLV